MLYQALWCEKCIFLPKSVYKKIGAIETRLFLLKIAVFEEAYFPVICCSIESAINMQSASRYSLAASASKPAGFPR